MNRFGIVVVLTMCIFSAGVGCAWGDELNDTVIYNRLSRQADALLGSQFEPTGIEWAVSLEQGHYLDVGFTMHANVHYRVVVVSTLGEGAVRYRLFDVDRNALFDSYDYGNPSWWDFLLTSTISIRVNLYGMGTSSSRGKGHILVRVAFSPTDRLSSSVGETR